MAEKDVFVFSPLFVLLWLSPSKMQILESEGDKILWKHWSVICSGISFNFGPCVMSSVGKVVLNVAVLELYISSISLSGGDSPVS